MKLYTYAIIDSSNQINEPIYGLEGACVYNIPYCDIGAVVSEFTEPVQNNTKGNVLAHEEIVERLMEHFAVLPVRFQTIIDGRDNLLSMMQSYYKDFRNNLDRLRNKIEFGIKVIWPSDKIKEHIINTYKKSSQKVSISDDSSNKRFMRNKFEKYKLDEEFQAKADKFINVMDLFFSKFAAEKKLKKLKTEDLLLDAVYLVKKDRQDDFREAFEHIKSPHISLKFLFSGPWPAYNFVILPKKSDLLKDSEQEDLLDKVIQHQDLVGADKI
ncbi:MAG TPA: GvpL/GvpF family gas vesicle protein [Desulfatiglandales bacterium]|nr:GvpL/GvpF family gas vesicle protein [Desulfatiglandales bacterium]